MEPTLPPGRHKMPLAHDGVDRPYLLQVPPRPASPAAGGSASAETAGPAGRLPLVLELHGRGIDPVRFDRMTGFGELADRAGFVLAMPAAIGEIWNDGRLAGPADPRADDAGYLLALLDDAVRLAPVDPRRIYVVGMSNGATMAGRLACEHAERFAGVAQVAGTVASSVAAVANPLLPLPILNVAATADRMSPYEGGVRHGAMARAMIRHAAGPSLGVDEWARFWVAANGAADPPEIVRRSPDTTVRIWHGPAPSSDVVFYRVEGAGHTWPGSRIALPSFVFGRTSRTFEAATVCWEFFAAHPR